MNEAKTYDIIDSGMAWGYHVVPKHVRDDVLYFFCKEELDNEKKEELSLLTGYEVDFEFISQNELLSLLNKHYRKADSINIANQNSRDFVTELIVEAEALGSSDIHIERYEKSARARIRIDGKLIEKYRMDVSNYDRIVNEVKILSSLDIAEKRLPQDGRIQMNTNQKKFDIRVSVLPVLNGEKVVLRLLSKDSTNIQIDKLGLSEDQKKIFLKNILKPNGIVLISGPTGSGKTTSLYASLKLLNDTERNIVTVEDPVEYTLEGINQVHLKESIGLDFTAALKSFLRQDPDVIMLGEIRDAETAKMAIRASLTGHLVLSTIHTNSAVGTISRLVDMGVPPFLIAETLNISVAQRLVRLLCNSCKTERTDLNTEELELLGVDKDKVKKDFVPNGCEHCHYTGYSGRKAIYEIIEIGKEESTLIKDYQNQQLEEIIEGTVTLRESAVSLYLNGETSLKEIISIL